MIVVKIVQLDYDDYQIGTARKIYGPFDDAKQAQKWIDKKFPLNLQTGRYEGLFGRERAQVSSLDIIPPD